MGSLNAQVTVKGRAMDAISGELLENVLISTRNQSAQTAKDGTFSLVLPMGEYLLVAKLDGYDNDSIFIQADRNLITDINFKLENMSASMQAVQITTSIAKNRKTPVAYSNVTGKDIAERLGSQDLPLLLNQMPGVYATSQGGGSGDARISIRGFSQRNIAVMVDGIPVNDMENGQVYWSNWFGLGSVTALTQVQRGLGSSRIANPAVGGTMNIITKGLSQQAKLEASVEFGDSKYEQFGVNYSSGRLKGDWGVMMSFTKRQSAGYVDYLFDDMYSYFGKAEKQWKTKSHGSHTLSIAVMGAPQSHGQRSYRARLSMYDKALAEKLGVDTVLPRMAYNQGRKYNQHWGNLNQATVSDDKTDTIWGRSQVVNERVNMFHKPQMYVKHDWALSKKTLITSTVYASYGRGGGVSSNSSLKIPQIPQNYGQFDFQSTYFLNTSGSDFTTPIDPKYSLTENKSTGILQRAVNNHNWYGLLSTAQHKINNFWSFTGGIDLRTYHGRHYREGYDLLGGDYFIPSQAEKNPNYDAKHMYRSGDVFGYNNDGLV
ncbi:MAG: TonB-dependent receptor plug domain-containing protein, partial [Bacteroidota bacterium]